jgi:histidine triad (HIT) family protein
MKPRTRSSNPDCVFCDVKKITSSVDVVYADNFSTAVMVFEPLAPVTPGHLLVAPVEHVPCMGYDSRIDRAVMQVAGSLVYDNENCNVITSKGTAATQTIFHFHVHVVPRETNDGLKLPWSLE